MMANTLFSIFFPLAFTVFTSFLSLSNGISYCNGPCKTGNDCSGLLICINGKCNDDPEVETHICGGEGSGGGGSSLSSPSNDDCKPSGTLTCKGKSYPKFSCSPPITSATKASLTLNDFSDGGDGGGPSEYDDSYQEKSEVVVALSTGWYDDNHAGQPPCKNNIVDGSDAVWEALGLNKDLGVVDVTWSFA